jgi:glycosyltransferase involved in cell wall biosynthesis
MTEPPTRLSSEATGLRPRRELISLIVTTYNREDALAAVLRGLARQTDKNFEVIAADDGSRAPTAGVIAAWTPQFERLAHVWHEDRGFRAAEIRNRAILASSGQLCIFLDGDCIPRPDFVAAHRRLVQPGAFVAGNRVLLSPALTARILREHLEPELWTMNEWLAQRISGGINRLAPLVSLPLGPLRRFGGAAWRSIRTANLAVWRSDLIKVDGFDAAFSGWGREDSDLVVRLMRSGVRRKDGRYATAVLHLWHAEADRSCLPQNDRLLADAMRLHRVKASIGLSALNPEPQSGVAQPASSEARLPGGR